MHIIHGSHYIEKGFSGIVGGQGLAEFAIMSIIGYHKHQTKYGRLFVLKEPRGEY